MTGFPEYPEYDATGLARLVADGQVHPRELVEAAVAAIEELDPRLNAVIHPLFDEAHRRATGDLPAGPFRGVPFLLKDLGPWYAGVPLTSGSRSRRGFVPEAHSELVRRYLEAGLVVVGKTNTPELGLAPTTEPELHGPTRNPWDPSRSAGGSSGGSAAAVAARMVPAAHGNDGGGSIRIPASACGLFGLKPSRGRTPQDPSVGESWFGLSADHVLTRSVRDSAALLDATAGPTPGAPYAAPPAARPFAEEVGADPGRLRIAVCPRPLMGDRMDAECSRAVEETAALCADLGHRVEEAVPEVDGEALRDAFLRLVAADTAFEIRQGQELTGRRPSPVDYELLTWITGLVGRELRADELAAAWAEMRRAGLLMARFFEGHDVLLTSTLARPPWPLGDLDPTPAETRLLRAVRRVPLGFALRRLFREMAAKVLEPIPNTPLFNLTGQPAASLPLAWTGDGLPVGVQISAPYGDEATLFRLAGQLEEARPWGARKPAMVDDHSQGGLGGRLGRAVRTVTVAAALLPAAAGSPAAAQPIDPEASRVRWFPDTTAFAPLLADPRETWLRGSFVLADRTLPDDPIFLPEGQGNAQAQPRDFEGRNIEAEVALGLRFPVVLLQPESRGRPSVAIEFETGVFARFFLEAPERDLINTDFRVGAPISIGYRGWEARIELRHMSSHFGDDFVNRFEPELRQVSQEGVELLVARRFARGVRLYAGGEANFNISDGSRVERTAARWGVEYDPGRVDAARRVWPFVAAGFRLTSLTDEVAGTGVGGVAFRVGGVGLRLETRGHFGPSPMGQLRRFDENFWGLGLRIEPRGLF